MPRIKPPATSLLRAALTLALGAGCATGAAPTRINVAEHGVVGDGKTVNSRAFQAAIDECARDGGGTLVVPKGVFVTGALFLKPGVDLELLDGAVLKGSTDINDYPTRPTRVEGHVEPWPAALLNGDKVDHLRITGPGTLDGSGPTFWQAFRRRRAADRKTTNLNVPRPRLAFIEDSADVRVSGVHFDNSGFWNLHLYRCRQVTVDGCQFRSPDGVPGPAPSTDGIDVDSSQDVTISKCLFAVGDDDIALKGSKGPFALRDAASPPVERVHILDSVFDAGGGIVTAGSEATVVRDVDVERCTVRHGAVLRLKLRPDTPQQYEDFRLHDITLDGPVAIFAVGPWKQYFDLQGQPPPTSTVRHVTIWGVRGSGGTFGTITGNANAAVSDVAVADVDVTLRNGSFDAPGVEGVTFRKVIVNGKPVSAPSPPPDGADARDRGSH
jgi:polygalacturonase